MQTVAIIDCTCAATTLAIGLALTDSTGQRLRYSVQQCTISAWLFSFILPLVCCRCVLYEITGSLQILVGIVCSSTGIKLSRMIATLVTVTHLDQYGLKMWFSYACQLLTSGYLSRAWLDNCILSGRFMCLFRTCKGDGCCQGNSEICHVNEHSTHVACLWLPHVDFRWQEIRQVFGASNARNLF